MIKCLKALEVITKYLLLILSLTIASCNWAKRKARETINKTGEVVAKTGSEFVNGVSKGVEKTFENEVIFSRQLQWQGLHSGKIIIHGTDSTTDNILSAYLIFENDFNQSITVKVTSEAGGEYGRVAQTITGQKGSARYIDFVFDKRTNIESKGTLMFE